MIVKPDVTLVARMLISQHGGACLDLAEKKADELDADGNMGGLAYWRQVLCAIEEELSPSMNAMHH
jgi:hypothetical protein